MLSRESVLGGVCVGLVGVVGGLLVVEVRRRRLGRRVAEVRAPSELEQEIVGLRRVVSDLQGRVGESVLEANVGGVGSVVETVGGDATWEALLHMALDLHDEGVGDIVDWVPRSEVEFLGEGWLRESFNAKWGTVTSPPFTVWTSDWVYFPVRRNVGEHVRELVGCAPLSAGVGGGFPMEHVG